MNDGGAEKWDLPQFWWSPLLQKTGSAQKCSTLKRQMGASPRPLPVLLPDPARVSVERVELAGDVVVIVAGATAKTATCPICDYVWVYSRDLFPLGHAFYSN